MLDMLIFNYTYIVAGLQASLSSPGSQLSHLNISMRAHCPMNAPAPVAL